MDPIQLLLVEDNPVEVFMVRAALGRAASAEFQVDNVDRLSAAIARVGSPPMDVVLLDLGLPDTKGLATFPC